MQKNFNDFSMQEALRLAKTDAGQQLLALMQQQNGDQLKQAMDHAAAGNYRQASDALSALLASPQAQALIKQLGGK
ncbi:MAG: hypothetical protein IJO56_00265 [Oscillospiraceae bacterium]|nr:hypothetical protein [Oscillospiraceae bacterium]